MVSPEAQEYQPLMNRHRLTWREALCGTLLLTAGYVASATDSSSPREEVQIAKPLSSEQLNENMRAVRLFYEFWNTGDETLLARSISPVFTDRTLPRGRPQGPTGPTFASQMFRKAVPDLRVTIEKLLICNDYVTVHMTFTGHFTGSFGETKGGGQEIRFIATDLLRVTAGRISDNWHIEDNLTLLQQMGLVARSP